VNRDTTAMKMMSQRKHEHLGKRVIRNWDMYPLPATKVKSKVLDTYHNSCFVYLYPVHCGLRVLHHCPHRH